MVIDVNKLIVNTDIPHTKKKPNASSSGIDVNFSPGEGNIGNKNIVFSYEKDNINKSINIKPEIPSTPQECDYYFETREDFNNRRDGILTENNNDLHTKTFGFGDGVTDLSNAFSSTLITSTPKILFARNITTVKGCFYECASLIDISKNLFINSPKISVFDTCFFKCIGIREIPRYLLKSNTEATDFSRCFISCTSLTTIPIDLFDNCTKIIACGGCFYKCTNITSALPELWNKSKFPGILDSSGYAYMCNKAANFSSVPEDFI